MVMGWIFTGLVGISILASVFMGTGAQLGAGVAQGAQAGITLAASMAGSICLWTGLGRVMEKGGFTKFLSRILGPLLHRLFPDTKEDPLLAGDLSANICANLLGLGNAATPMGIRAAQRMAKGSTPGDGLCRLIVLNTASIQLIPATVGAVRASLGAQRPFDILPAVWLASLCSAGMGIGAAVFFGKVWRK